jgi:hypothetical protein
VVYIAGAIVLLLARGRTLKEDIAVLLSLAIAGLL